MASNGRQNHQVLKEMVVKITSLTHRSGILLYCADTDGITCVRKSSGDEKQLIDLEWPNRKRMLVLFHESKHVYALIHTSIHTL